MSERVKDWLTGNEMDIQGLLRVAEASEDVPEDRFNMEWWKCGSVACLIGNFCLTHPGDALTLNKSVGCQASLVPTLGKLRCEMAVEARFRLTSRESEFLFQPRFRSSRQWHAKANTREHVIRRLRKFIYYKLRKNELLADYEKARRTGDVGVMQEAEENAGRLRLAEV